MPIEVLDTKGWKCPKPTLEMTIRLRKLSKGDILEVIGDCPTFERDVRSWCQRMRKVLLWLRDEGGDVRRCQVQI